jgi:predicted amidohydrolase
VTANLCVENEASEEQTIMKITVCELSSATHKFHHQWKRLLAHMQQSQSELLVLPELPVSPWLCASPHYNAELWQAAVSTHQAYLHDLMELPFSVVGTRPVSHSGQRHNRGFFTENGAYHDVHTKRYLPDEAGFWEASWYQPGDGTFKTFDTAQAKCGMLICTDIWFLERARQYGRAGAQLIFNPRANYPGSEEQQMWQIATQAAAFSSGAWVLTSNLLPPDAEDGASAQAWIVSPDGEVVAQTSVDQPFVTYDLDVGAAVSAKTRYPCYVKE